MVYSPLGQILPIGESYIAKPISIERYKQFGIRIKDFRLLSKTHQVTKSSHSTGNPREAVEVRRT